MFRRNTSSAITFAILYLFVQLGVTKILRFIKFLILQSQKRRRRLSKIVCLARRVINNKTILCKVSVASVIVDNYVEETNNSSVNFRKFFDADRTEYQLNQNFIQQNYSFTTPQTCHGFLSEIYHTTIFCSQWLLQTMEKSVTDFDKTRF